MYTLFQKTVSLLIIASIIFSPINAYADVVMPASGVIVDGSGSIGTVVQDTVNGTATQTIKQTSERMVANWNSFSIGHGGTVTFAQPGQSSIALNRVTGGTPSEIYGTLNANGRIFLVNPNGVLFGADSHVNTLGLLASTLDIKNEDFMAGNYKFAGEGGAAVVNAGTLNAPGGFVALLGSSVENSGAILADLGTIALASGDAITVGLDSQSVISVVIDQATSTNPGSKDTAVANLAGGSLTADGGKILLTAQVLEEVFNKAINNAGVIEAGSLELHNGIVELSANGDIKSNGVISAAESVKIASDGDVLVDGGSISAAIEGSGIAYLDIKGQNITINSASLSASSLKGGFNWAYVQMSGSDSVSILNSSVLAQTSSNNFDEAQVYIQGRNLTIDASTITAQATGNSYGSARIYLGHDPSDYYWEGDVDTENINIINGSTLRAEITKGSFDAEAVIETDLTGTLYIDHSALNAIAGVFDASSVARSYINLNLFGEGAGDVIILNSHLSARVLGEGHAAVRIYNSENDWYFREMLGGILGYFTESDDMSGPIWGSVNITNSTILAEARSTSEFDFNNMFNDPKPTTGVIGMMSCGPIQLVNSTLTAQELNHPAVVGLLSDSYVTLDATSSISALANNSIAAVGILAMDTDEGNVSINMPGTIRANAGDGIGVVGLLGPGDVNASGSITASGNADGVGFIGGLLSEYLPFPMITLGLPGNLGSAILIGSIFGDVTLGDLSADLVGVAALGGPYYEEKMARMTEGDPYYGSWGGNIFGTNGTTSARLFLLLARRNIGTAAQPIKTDVDVVAGYSWEEGDIYLNEANDIALGLFVPVTVGGANWTETDSFLPEDYSFDLGIGISLAAENGIVHVESQGDMVVNSIIAPQGGVYLKTFNGSIYAGNGWDPTLFGLVKFLDSMGGRISDRFYEFLGTTLGMLMIDNPFVDPESDIFHAYFLPVMLGVRAEDGSLLNDGPNVVAGGYSYFSSPNGTIGVGYPTDKNPDISGQIVGIVRPGTTAVTGLNPSIDLDLSLGLPPGLVFYDDNNQYSGSPTDGSAVSNIGPQQVWPQLPVMSPVLPNVNPLRVHIEVLPNSKSALPDGFTPIMSGLTLQIGKLNQQVPDTDTDTGVSQLVNPLFKAYRAYYEILKNFRLVSIEPMNPSTFFAYHPLSEADMGAFEGINLDVGAYEFIDGNLNYNGNVNPYLK